MNNKFRKILAFSLPVLAAASLGLSSCGNGEDPNTLKIELRTTAGADTIKVLQNLAAKFEKNEAPKYGLKVKITVNKYSGDYAALANNIKSGFSAGTHPDMAMVYPDAVAEFIENGFAYNLETYMNDPEIGWTKEDKTDIISAYLEEGRQYVVPGTYSLPFSKSTELMYYNASILGLKLTNPKTNEEFSITANYLENLTWEEFFEVLCPAIMTYNDANNNSILKKEGTAGDGYAVLGYDSDDNLFITLAEQYGIPYTKVDQESGEGSFLFKNDEMKEKVYEWSKYAQKNYVLTAGSTGKRANDYFKTNQILFSIGSTAGSKYQWQQGNDIRVTRIPHAKDKDPKTIMQGPSMAFLSHKDKDGNISKDRQKASWLFYRFLAEKENSLTWAMSADYMPIRLSGYESPDYKEKYNEENYETTDYGALTARIASYVKEVTPTFFTNPAFKGSNTCRTQVGAIMTKAISKDASKAGIDEQFDKAYAECIKDSK